MAHSNGQAGWILDGAGTQSPDEKREVEEQTLNFINSNLDIFRPLTDRIAFIKATGNGDALMLMSSALGILSNELYEYLKANALVVDDKKMS